MKGSTQRSTYASVPGCLALFAIANAATRLDRFINPVAVIAPAHRSLLRADNRAWPRQSIHALRTAASS